jgi:hypothetical protein
MFSNWPVLIEMFSIFQPIMLQNIHKLPLEIAQRQPRNTSGGEGIYGIRAYCEMPE